MPGKWVVANSLDLSPRQRSDPRFYRGRLKATLPPLTFSAPTSAPDPIRPVRFSDSGRSIGIERSLTAPPSPPPDVRVTYPAVRQIRSMCRAYRLCTPTGASLPAAPTSVSFQPPGLRPMGSPNAIPLFLGKRLLLSFNPLAGEPVGPSVFSFAAHAYPELRLSTLQCLTSVAASHLICPLLMGWSPLPETPFKCQSGVA